jgi:V/A-type H+/Na+-transporting ATPase subunit D
MGIRYPSEATFTPPDAPMALPCSAAVVAARAAARTALQAAIHHAVAREAERRVALEITTTRQRIRALEKRWIPRLNRAIHAVDPALDEMERSDAARLLRAADSAGTPGGTEGPTPMHSYGRTGRATKAP